MCEKTDNVIVRGSACERIQPPHLEKLSSSLSSDIGKTLPMDGVTLQPQCLRQDEPEEPRIVA